MLDINILIPVLTIWMEARGEGPDGMQAVAWSLINRHAAGKWYSGKTLADTCIVPFAFSCWNTGDPNRRAAMQLSGNEQILSDIAGYLQNAITGSVDDPTNGATHYIDNSIMPPAWAQEATQCAQIGRLIFYKGVS